MHTFFVLFKVVPNIIREKAIIAEEMCYSIELNIITALMLKNF